MRSSIVLMALVLFCVSCGSKNSSGTSSSSGGGFTWSGPLILSGLSSGTVFTEIANSGGPVTNAAVTLGYSGGSYPLSYFYSISAAVTYSGAVTTISVAYYDNTSFTYAAGQPYTITANISGTTYTATATTVGTPVFSTSGSNLVCTWTGGGTENTITAIELTSPYTSKIFGPNLSSPYSIANSSLPGGTGQNSVSAAIVNLNTSAFANTTTGSYLLTNSQAQTTY